MKLHDDPDTDSLYIEFEALPSAGTRKIAEDVNIDIDATGAVVGLDIDHAPRKLDLTTSETDPLPFRSIEAA